MQITSIGSETMAQPFSTKHIIHILINDLIHVFDEREVKGFGVVCLPHSKKFLVVGAHHRHRRDEPGAMPSFNFG